jgi:DNA-binding HxlR family transcriptional regulator
MEPDREPRWDRDVWTTQGCSVAAALEVVGTRSAMLLLREAFYGTRRFDDFARRVGVTESIASARLRELVAAGLLRKEPYREEGQRTRYEYRLTPMGKDLRPVLVALMQWGDRWLSEGPVELRHRGCHAKLHAVVRCEAGHDVEAIDTEILPTPSAVPA